MKYKNAAYYEEKEMCNASLFLMGGNFKVESILISWREAMRYRIRKDVIFVDVREKKEYDKYHLEGAKHVELEELEAWLRERDEEVKIIFYCEHGNQSIKAARFARKYGWQAYSINGGIHWKEEKKG